MIKQQLSSQLWPIHWQRELVKNLRKEPGGNITGTSDQSDDAISAQVDMIKQVLLWRKQLGYSNRKSELTRSSEGNAKKIMKLKAIKWLKTILDINNVKAAADSIMSEADIVFVDRQYYLQWTL